MKTTPLGDDDVFGVSSSSQSTEVPDKQGGRGSKADESSSDSDDGSDKDQKGKSTEKSDATARDDSKGEASKEAVKESENSDTLLSVIDVQMKDNEITLSGTQTIL